MVVLWLLAVASGWYYCERYEFAKSDASVATAVEHWPGGTSLTYDSSRPALVLFLHPKCPCSRATLAELDRILATGRQPNAEAPQVIVVATVPPGKNEAWWNTATIENSRSIPEASVFIDYDGREAARFGATTSGTVMYFDQSGARCYAGGITITRGHEGRSAGGDALAALIRGDSVESMSMPVFGCRLCLPAAEPGHEVVERRVDRSGNQTPADTAI